MDEGPLQSREAKQLDCDALRDMLASAGGAAGRSPEQAAADAGCFAAALASRRRPGHTGSGSSASPPSPLPSPPAHTLRSAQAVHTALSALDHLSPNEDLPRALVSGFASVSVDRAASAVTDALERAGINSARCDVRIHLSPELGRNEASICRPALERVGAIEASDPSTATHILTSSLPQSRQSPARFAGPVRVVAWHKDSALIHTPGEPPSCDWWTKSSELQQWYVDASNVGMHGPATFNSDAHGSSDPQQQQLQQGPKHRRQSPLGVLGQWLSDSLMNGEWMDELEYIDPYRVHPPQSAKYHGRNEQLHRSASANGALPVAPSENVPARGQKRDAEGSVVEREMHGLPSEVMYVASADGPYAGTYSGMAGRVVENISQGQQSFVNYSASRQRMKAQLVARQRSGQPVVPAYSAWFDWQSISDIEKRSLPEFFDKRSTSKTPESYLRARNHMINKWRESAPQPVSFTNFRKELAGDAAALMRVFNFLEQWGLLNFGSSQQQHEQRQQQQQQRQQEEDQEDAKLLTVSSAPPRWSDTIYNFSSCHPSIAASKQTSSDLAARSSVQLQTPSEVYCDVTGEDLTNQPRYHCIHSSHPDLDISPSAYAEGNFPTGLSSADFVRIDPCASNSFDNSDWSDDEVLLLLEAVELHGDSWEDVASHVGSRSAHECLLRFVQLPLEDRALGEVATSASKPEPLSTNDPIPFEDASNPVMANIAVLTTMVGPKVASAAAQAALKTLEEEHDSPKKSQEGEQATQTERAEERSTGAGEEDEAPSAKAMAKSASEALGAAAVKAKLLANQEEREVHKETNALLDQQAKKVEAKVSLLEQITTALSSERDAVDAEKQQIMNERVQLQQQRNELASKLRELQAQQQQQQQQYSQPPPPAPMEFGQQPPPH